MANTSDCPMPTRTGRETDDLQNNGGCDSDYVFHQYETTRPMPIQYFNVATERRTSGVVLGKPKNSR